MKIWLVMETGCCGHEEIQSIWTVEDQAKAKSESLEDSWVVEWETADD